MRTYKMLYEQSKLRGELLMLKKCIYFQMKPISIYNNYRKCIRIFKISIYYGFYYV